MQFSEQWLREWVNPSISTDELVAQLTMAGLEVDGVEPVAGEFSGVVVGQVKEKIQHPDADKSAVRLALLVAARQLRAQDRCTAALEAND